ncbi:MAG: ABC transporter permease [Acidobacteriaceae bacterium]
MNLSEALTESVDSLRRNRLRSGLTMLGIVWGLVTVVLLLSYGRAVGNAVMEGFLGFGNDVIMVWGGQTSMQAGGQRSGQKIHLKDGDMEAIRDSLPFLSAISRETDSSFSVKYGPKVVLIQSKAVDLPYGRMRRLDIGQGRYFEPDDFSDHRQVIIFGAHAAQKLFNGYPPVGEVVEVEGQPFTVIGVLRNKIQDSSNNGPDNENIFVPFDTMRTLRQQRDPDSIVFQPSTPELHLEAIQAVRTVLAQRHHFNPLDTKAISTWDTIEDGKQLVQFSFALQVLLGIIGAMTLAVGGVGVMNIMLVSVTERTREIGLMKALGARPRDILAQFLLESLVLTFLAGVAGVIVSIVTTYLVPPMPLYSAMYKTANHDGDIILHASMGIMLASFIILGIVGIVSGLLPAIRAAKMDPVVALRHE